MSGLQYGEDNIRGHILACEHPLTNRANLVVDC